MFLFCKALGILDKVLVILNRIFGQFEITSVGVQGIPEIRVLILMLILMC
jgi:hypothetical protein